MKSIEERQGDKAIALEAAQLAVSLQAQISREQMENVSKKAAEDAVTAFHQRYELQPEHWVFLKELRVAHQTTGSWVKKFLIIAVLSVSLSFGADAILNELQTVFQK